MRRRAETQRFYKWVAFPYAGHWLLDVHAGTFRLELRLTQGTPLADPPTLDLAVVTPGKPMDFGRTPMGLPVVSAGAAELLLRMAPDDVQLVACRIDGSDRGFRVVNIIARLDCVDRHRSKRITIGGPRGAFPQGSPRWIIRR